MEELRTNLLGLTREQLADFSESIGQPPYRGHQIFGWLYAKGAGEFRAMTDLGKSFRSLLEDTAAIAGVNLVKTQKSARDGTTKLLFGLQDGLKIESVLIPPASEADDELTRLTLCVSTQVGCPLDCAFCATGTMGFLRNLTAGEIVDQVLQAKRVAKAPITNLVFMGMGEPLLNYDALMSAMSIIVDGIGIAARRITVSTAGRTDRIRQLADENRRMKLAVSLHSAVDETRSRLMPINRKYNIRELTAALEYYYRATKQRVTHEVIFFEGINDTPYEVAQLIKFARRVPSKINVIPYHSIDFTGPAGFAATLKPSPGVEEIVERLRAGHLTVMVRGNAGEDIDAACGQLAVKSAKPRRHASSNS